MTDLAVSGPALRFVAGALLTLACHERNASESVALPSANAAAPRVLASASAARAPNPPRAELDLNAQVAALRDSLLKKDREVFARALAYPVRVNTRSRCWVLLTDAPAFLRHFDEIVSPAVERAIRDAKPDSSSAKSYRQGLGGGDVWLQLGHPPVIFNTDIWDIPGEPCDNWQVEPTPRWLHGSWVFAAVASAEPWNEHGSPRRWGSASLRMKTANSSTSSAM